jgi:hypothetical protein
MTADRDLRVRELSRMCKSSLVAIVRRNHPHMWTAHPLERWSKDDLINEVLRDEYGVPNE